MAEVGVECSRVALFTQLGFPMFQFFVAHVSYFFGWANRCEVQLGAPGGLLQLLTS